MSTLPLKVLFITRYMAAQRHGPSRKSMLLLGEFEKEKGTKFDLRFLTEDPPANSDVCYTVKIPRWQDSSVFKKYYQSWSYHKEINNIHKNWPFDIVCFNDAQQGIFSAILDLPGKAKLIAFINDDNSALPSRRSYDHLTRFFYRKLQRLSERYVARMANKVICCSDYLTGLISEQYKLSTTPKTLRPAINLSEWSSSTQSSEKRVDGSILFVKSEPRRGGLAVLLEALRNKEVLSKVAHLHLGGFPTEQFHKEFSHLLPPTLKYTIHGHLDRSRLKELVSTCHIGVVPSMYEAYGITAREFLAGGLLTIVSNSGGLPEAVQGSNAEIFEAHNSKELSIKLQHALSKAPQNGVTTLDKYDSGEMYRKFKEIIYSTTNQANLP